uniref:Cellular tumor antigen p53 n=1 Tax=Lygus hesperus TaxID=30085 RepID=A0A0A9WKI7_LYGHE
MSRKCLHFVADWRAGSRNVAITKRSSLIMDLDNAEIEDMDMLIEESGLPAELNQLKTTELLPAVHNYQGLTGFLNEDQYDPLDSEVNNIKVESYLQQSHVSQHHTSSELPNSTMPSTPLPTCTHPCLEDFEGEFGFTLSYDALNTNPSNSWSYSEVLKQVFIKMNNVLLIQFKTNRPLSNDRFFIRALLVYQNNDFMNQAVNRCSIHWIDDDSSQLAHRSPRFCECEKYHLAGHVLRCQTEGAQYQFDPNSERHSVIVDVPRTPQSGSDFIKAVHYFFSCKTSCPKGMQRRAVQVVFTLEDDRCQVYGRKVLPVKICSCPKRDKDRQEKDFHGEDVCDKKGIKRAMSAIDLDTKPTKIVREAALYNLQLRHATRESLETALVDLVAKQKKDLALMKNVVSNFESRQNSIAEIVKQFSAFR